MRKNDAKENNSFEYDQKKEYASLDIVSDLLEEGFHSDERILTSEKDTKRQGIKKDGIELSEIKPREDSMNIQGFQPVEEFRPRETDGLVKDKKQKETEFPLCLAHINEEAILFCLSCLESCMCVECFIKHKKENKKGAPHDITNIMSKTSLKELRKASEDIWEQITAKSDVFKLFEKNLANKNEAFKNRMNLTKLHINESFQDVRDHLNSIEQQALTIIERFASQKLSAMDKISQNIEKNTKFVGTFENILKRIDKSIETNIKKPISNNQRAELFNSVASERKKYTASVDTRVEETVQEISKTLTDINESLTLDIGIWKELSRLERVKNELMSMNVVESLEIFLNSSTSKLSTNQIISVDRGIKVQLNNDKKVHIPSRAKQSSSISTDLEEEQSKQLFKKKPTNKTAADSLKSKIDLYNNYSGRVISFDKEKPKLYNTPASPEGSLNFSNEREETNIANRESSGNTPGHDGPYLDQEQKDKMRFYDKILTDILSAKKENGSERKSIGRADGYQHQRQQIQPPAFSYGSIKNADEAKSGRKRVKKTPAQAYSHSSTMGYDSQKKTLNTLDDSYGSIHNHSSSRGLGGYNKSMERNNAKKGLSPLKKDDLFSITITSPIHIKSPSMGSFSVRDSLNCLTSPGRRGDIGERKHFFSVAGGSGSSGGGSNYMEEILQRQKEKFDRKKNQFFFA
jgi:hypothetical protein